METISLKALSYKVLERNLKGNSMETAAKKEGNFEAKKEGKSFHSFHDGTMTETDIKKMPLSDFGKAGLIVKVYSEVLNDHILFISDDAALTLNPLDLVSYTAKELTAMLNMQPEELKAIHEVKTIFHKGRVIAHNRVTL